MLGVSKKVMMSKTLQDMFEALPRSAQQKPEVSEKYETLKNLINNPLAKSEAPSSILISGGRGRYERSPEHRIVRAKAISDKAKEKRRTEVFDLDGYSRDSRYIVGWENLIEELGLKESTIRVSFSRGKGSFEIHLDDWIYNVRRTGIFATDEQIAAYKVEEAHRLRAEIDELPGYSKRRKVLKARLEKIS